MMKAIFTVFGAVSGFIQGVILYAIIGSPLHPSVAEAAQGMWTDYGSLIFGVIGATIGAIMGWWSIHVSVSAPRQDVFTARKFQGLGSLSKRESQA
jgi:hypothetical protein